MKVALILTGLARKVEEGYNQYWKYVIDNNDVDLFLHAWESKPDGKTNHEDSDEVLRVYPNATYCKIEKPFSFTEYRNGIDNPNNDKSRPLTDFDVYGNFRSFPMFYSWESTYNEFKKLCKIDYDCVIRSRYDISGSNLDISKLDLSKINTTNKHYPNSSIHDDNFLITNQENADKIFSNIFTDIIIHHKKLGYINSAEINFTEYLKRYELDKISVKSNDINFTLLRDNKLWF